MAKVQFNCRLEESTVEKINAEVERLRKLHGFGVSQGDVIELKFVGPIQSSKKMSKHEQKIAAMRAQDPMADQRPEIEYGSDELPSGGSVTNVGAAVPLSCHSAKTRLWQQTRERAIAVRPPPPRHNPTRLR